MNFLYAALSTTHVVIIVVIAVVILLALIIAGLFISIRNKLVTLRNECDEAWASIDVFLKKRYDLIPNLVETVKGYTKHESETLEKVVAARNAAVSASGSNDKINADKELGGVLRQLFALTESYPDLKANSQFLDLQSQLKGIETDLSQARKYYNGKCKALNIQIDKFPSNLVANRMKMSKRTYFELASEEERQHVKVSF